MTTTVQAVRLVRADWGKLLAVALVPAVVGIGTFYAMAAEVKQLQRDVAELRAGQQRQTDALTTIVRDVGQLQGRMSGKGVGDGA